MPENVVSSQENEHELTDLQQKFIAAMLLATSVTEACEALGVAKDTGYRWLKTPIVKEAYREARREAFEHAYNSFLPFIQEAINTVALIMRDAKNPASVRLKAADILLTRAMESHKVDEIE